MAYKVHIGSTRGGRERWRVFATFADAVTFCDRVHRQTGVILSIVRK